MRLLFLTTVLCLPALAQDGGVSPQETTVTDERRVVDDERASSVVRQGDFERRLPRSAPDALRYEPGVFVQQTAHGQGSAFLRGLTGQQTLLLFDGIRLNNSTWRQGPNQYFFTIDSRTIESIEVVRGGGSTRFGCDALGGVIAALPGRGAARRRPRALLALAHLEGDLGRRGGRRPVRPAGLAGAHRLRGRLRRPARGVARERWAGDRARSTARCPRCPASRPIAAPSWAPASTSSPPTAGSPGAPAGTSSPWPAYAYRQFDAPRTDQCPPPFARSDECLTYKEQFRTLTYAAWKARFEDVESARVTLSWQRQHEVREGARPASFVLNTGRDTVDTLGLSLVLKSRPFAPGQGVSLALTGGAEAYVDLVSSRSFVSFTDIAVTRELSRGQYLSGSAALTGGAFVDGALGLGAKVTLRTGGRVGVAAVNAPADAASGTSSVRGAWVPLAAHLGLEWRAIGAFSLLVNVDRSFRAPNLDDLTSRQQTGPGFQFENGGLRPERATTAELGARLRVEWLSLDAWAFQTWLEDAVVKQPRDVTDCPPSTPQCGSAWFRYQLQNAPGLSELRGVEASARLRLPSGFGVRASAAYTWGQGPTGVPLSRIPPANGTVELTWKHEVGLVLTAALRWAGAQTRLAVADLSDARIPLGGTPGYAVVDLRASVRFSAVLLTMVMENLLDTPWRAHGSSINGPGRGVMLLASFRAP